MPLYSLMSAFLATPCCFLDDLYVVIVPERAAPLLRDRRRRKRTTRNRRPGPGCLVQQPGWWHWLHAGQPGEAVLFVVIQKSADVLVCGA